LLIVTIHLPFEKGGLRGIYLIKSPLTLMPFGYPFSKRGAEYLLLIYQNNFPDFNGTPKSPA
jgi:hypothetical protein